MENNSLIELVQQRYDGDLSGYLNTPKKTAGQEKIIAKKQSNSENKEFIEADKDYKSALAYIKDIISPAFMKVYPDKIRINDTYAKTYFIYSYPSFLE